MATNENQLTEPLPICELPDHQNPVNVFLSDYRGNDATHLTYENELGQLAILAGYYEYKLKRDKKTGKVIKDADGEPELVRDQDGQPIPVGLPKLVPWHEWQAQWFKGLLNMRGLHIKSTSLVKTKTVIVGLAHAMWSIEVERDGKLVPLIDAEKRDRICKKLPKVKSRTTPAGRAIDPGELKKLYEVCRADPTPAGSRDAVILLALGYAWGMRRNEIVGIELADLDPETGALLIRHAKGGLERYAYLKNGGMSWVEEWLEHRGYAPGALLHPIDKLGRIAPRELSSQAIFKICEKRAKQAKIKPFSPHDLRRSRITHALDAGEPIDGVAEVVGHQRLDTTRRYDRGAEKRKEDAATRLAVPYEPPPWRAAA